MALRLILCGADAGNDLVTGELVVAAQRQQPALLLPSGPDVRRMERELAARGALGVRVVTFDKWLEEAWMLFGDGRRLVGTAARAALCGEVVAQAALDGLAISGRTPGFVDLLADLAKRAERPAEVSGGGVESEVAPLLAQYEERLHRLGLVELSRAGSSLAQDPPGLPGRIVISGFTDFAAEQEALIVGLAARNPVTVMLAWEEGRAATEVLTPLVTRLRSAGAECSAATPLDSHRHPELRQLTSCVFEGKSGLPAPEQIIMGEAAGLEAECALIAKLARSIVDGGASSKGMAIAFRDIGLRVPLLAAALRTEDVPAAFDVSLAFAKTPFGGAVQALLDTCVLRGDTRERALAFLLSPYSGANLAVVAGKDAGWRRSRSGPREILDSLCGLNDGGEIVKLARSLTQQRIDDESAPKWQKLAGMLLKNAQQRRGAADFESASDAACHRALLRAVSEVIDIHSDAGEMDLSRALRSVRVSVTQGDGQRGVLVTEAHRLRGLSFDAVILGGLTATEFSPGTMDSLLESLAGRLGLSPRADSRLSERMLFYSILTTARDRLALVRQATDEQGEAVRPSAFWDEVVDLYRPKDDVTGERWPTGLRRETLVLSDLASAAPAFLPGRIQMRRNAARTAPVPPARGILLSGDALAELAARDEVSVSEIETHISCPYKWFYQRVLRPRDIDTALDAAERGSLAHGVLAAFYGLWQASGKQRVNPEDLDDAMQCVDEAVEVCRAHPNRVPEVTLADEISVAKAIEWARDIVRDDVEYLPGLEPRHHELVFGRRVDLPVELAGVALKGSIDRIDVGPRGLVVTDYKSAATVDGKGSFENKGLLQVPIYAAVASSVLGLPVLGGVYRSLKTLSARGFWSVADVDLGDRGSSRDACTSEAVDEQLASAIDRMLAAVEGMKSGDIAPRPLNRSSCEYCEARFVCGEAL